MSELTWVLSSSADGVVEAGTGELPDPTKETTGPTDPEVTAPQEPGTLPEPSTDNPATPTPSEPTANPDEERTP